MTDIDPDRLRESLLCRAIERAEMAYLSSLRHTAEDPLVLVLDLSDPGAWAMVQGHARIGDIERMRAEGLDREGAPVVTWAVSTRWAREFSVGRVAGMAAAIDRIDFDPRAEFLIFVIAAGGFSDYVYPSPEG